LWASCAAWTKKLLRKRADALLATRKLRHDDGSGHSLVFEDTGDSPFELLNLVTNRRFLHNSLKRWDWFRH
jgi:hypothetical protein